MSDDFVQETDLESSGFHCCGNEDLYPFRCTSCGRLMVFCHECDTLYPDLNTLVPAGAVNCFDPKRPIFHCPQCDHAFEYYFMANPTYHGTFDQWYDAGFGNLLKSH
jgi:hypothetical protein